MSESKARSVERHLGIYSDAYNSLTAMYRIHLATGTELLLYNNAQQTTLPPSRVRRREVESGLFLKLSACRLPLSAECMSQDSADSDDGRTRICS